MRQYFAVALLVILHASALTRAGLFSDPESVIARHRRRTNNQQPSQVAPTVVFSFAFADSGNDFWPYRAGFVWEAEVCSTSDAESCQAGASSGGSANCGDAAMLVGLRFHAFRRQARRLMPFGSLMLGILLERVRSRQSHVRVPALRASRGGGLDLRRAGSNPRRAAVCRLPTCLLDECEQEPTQICDLIPAWSTRATASCGFAGAAAVRNDAMTQAATGVAMHARRGNDART